MTPLAKEIIKRYKCSGFHLGLERAADIVNAYVYREELNEYQYAALCLFVENRGQRAFAQSALLRIVNNDLAPNWELRAGREFLKPTWSQWKGKRIQRCVVRRDKEHRLWSTPYLYSNKDWQK